MNEKLTVFIISLIVATAVVLITALPFMLLWNWIVPDMFGLDKINFWEALGLLLLSNVLFKTTHIKTKEKSNSW